MTCLGETGEAVGEGEPPFLYLHPHPRGWAPGPGALARLRLPIPPCGFQSLGLDPCPSMATPVGSLAQRRRPRPLRATQPPGPCSRWASLGTLRRGPEAPRPPTPATLIRAPALPTPTPTGHLRSAAAMRSRLAAGAEPAWTCSRGGWGLAFAADQAPPRPRPRGPLRSPPLGEHQAWDAPLTDVGKLPGVAGVGRAVPGGASALFLQLARAPRTLRPSPPPPSSHPRRVQGDARNWAPPPPTLKNKNKTRPFRASWVCQGTGSLRPLADRSGLQGVPARGQTLGGGGGGGL